MQGMTLMGATLLMLCVSVIARPAMAEGLPNPFFAMDTGTKETNHTTAKAQADMLHDLGYAGIGYSGFEGVSEMLAALDAHRLRMFTVYLSADVTPDGFKYDANMKAGTAALKGRDAMLWLPISSSVYKPSDPKGDAQAVAMLREIAGLAAESGLRVALYPHTGCWLERVEDAVRVAKQVDRKNVGVTFNLCHWLMVTGGKDLKATLELARPYLFVVTINGADPGTGWDKLIQTLDRGSFDVAGLLALLKELGYTGPIGLQGYGIGGDVQDNLKRSMAAWETLSQRAAAAK